MSQIFFANPLFQILSYTLKCKIKFWSKKWKCSQMFTNVRIRRDYILFRFLNQNLFSGRFLSKIFSAWNSPLNQGFLSSIYIMMLLTVAHQFLWNDTFTKIAMSDSQKDFFLGFWLNLSERYLLYQRLCLQIIIQNWIGNKLNHSSSFIKVQDQSLKLVQTTVAFHSFEQLQIFQSFQFCYIKSENYFCPFSNFILFLSILWRFVHEIDQKSKDNISLHYSKATISSWLRLSITIVEPNL